MGLVGLAGMLSQSHLAEPARFMRPFPERCFGIIDQNSAILDAKNRIVDPPPGTAKREDFLIARSVESR